MGVASSTPKRQAKRVFLASKRGDPAQLTDLIRAGAHVEYVSRLGWTPLHHACARGHADCVALLLGAGADPNRRRRDGSTPLHLATKAGAVPIIRLLLERGADPDVLDYKSQSARDVAASLARPDLLALLSCADDSKTRRPAAAAALVEYSQVYLPYTDDEEYGEDTDNSAPIVDSRMVLSADSANYRAEEQSAAYIPDDGLPPRALVSTSGGKAVQQEQWTPAQVLEWLATVDGMSSVRAAFEEHDVSGSTLMLLTAEHLRGPDFNLSEFKTATLLAARDRITQLARIEQGMAQLLGILPGDMPDVEIPVVLYDALTPKPLDKIGEGAFGDVFRAVITLPSGETRDVVVKVPKHPEDDVIAANELAVRREELTCTLCHALLSARGRHPNVTTFVGVCNDVPSAAGACQVTTYHANGPLETFMVRHSERLREQWRAQPRLLFDLLRGIAAGLAFIHEANIVHGDLKPDNVALTSQLQPRIIDLGKARRINGKWPRGTRLYMCRFPPEHVIDRQYGFPGDVWMLGLLFLDVLRRAKRDPFMLRGGRSHAALKSLMLEAREAGDVPDVGIHNAVHSVFDSDSPIASAIIEALDLCLQLDPSARLQSGAHVVAALDDAWASFERSSSP